MADTAPSTQSADSATANVEYVTTRMVQEAQTEGLEGLSTDDIKALGESLWHWANDNTGMVVRLRPGIGHDDRPLDQHLLEVTGPDRPFLVDSLLGVCAEFNHEVQALFHPIVTLPDGTRKSMIQIHLPPLTVTECEQLKSEAVLTLRDLAIATGDYQAMRMQMMTEMDRISRASHIHDDYRDEAAAFLKWLANEHFVFLGMRRYSFATNEDGAVLPEEPEMIEGSNLGILRDEERNVLNRGAEPLLLTAEIGDFLSEPEPIIIAKATLVSRVHRRVQCDYVGVKHFGPNGTVIGETRFLGLFTAETYFASVKDVPLLRRRFEKVIETSGALKGTHNEKALTNLLESWPRDELFQTRSAELTKIMLGALNLIGRPRVRLFERRDRFNRFVNAIVFVPRETYDTRLRRRLGEALESAYEGNLTSFEPSFEGPALVRVIFEIALEGSTASPDLSAMEAELASMAKNWDSEFRHQLTLSSMDNEARRGAILFNGSFSAGYRDAFSPAEAIEDVSTLSKLSAQNPVTLTCYRRSEDPKDIVRAKIFTRNGAVALSRCVPVFEAMGLFVSFETGYPVSPISKPVEDAPSEYWIHDVAMRRADDAPVDIDEIGRAFEEAFVAVWMGRAENDGFNALVFNAGLSWREAALFRALCAYRAQSGLDPAVETQIEALNQYPALTDTLLMLFKARFSPSLESSEADRETLIDLHQDALSLGLRNVSSLDHDKVIRRLGCVIMATKRTNFFQTEEDGSPKPFISFKIASQELQTLPDPKPYREIFVASPQIDGVHCRFGPVARGGLRWSDRRGDFRTEVLGLVKAQQVKNAVIVPVGSKGGFYPKQILAATPWEDRQPLAIEAYKTFITALLELTDNIVEGEVIMPTNTVAHEEVDPYLVVAADKGTATFSDIANQISIDQSFWLGDAFASGGSAGYDHKKMGITARGAWEAVKRHFREIGKDIQTEPFTVIGCGDMSGDVFGNGMLLSRKIHLLAAFNHKHIFIDPNPVDAETCFEERQRLFDLGRSGWDDYNSDLISKGGGIFERKLKSIELTPEIKELIGLEDDAVTPDELIHALLKAETDLLWFGGIGTYIKAQNETHGDVRDRSNDALRINGRDLNAKVIGEGANLGATQAGRIEAALNGVRLNTDAIDNSAGVDSSDHEVNIKILARQAIEREGLAANDRDDLLAEMTDDVAEHVLKHNYDQTAALSLSQATAKRDHDALERLMVFLETNSNMDRSVEDLPDTSQMQARAAAGESLTRPELAVIMAWTKIILFDQIVASETPDDPYFETTLQHYFPAGIRGFEDSMEHHRLKREIISTVLANRIVDQAGPVFLWRLHEQSGRSFAEITEAFEVVRSLLSVGALKEQINALDNQASAQDQMALQSYLSNALSDCTNVLLMSPLTGKVQDRIAALEKDVEEVKSRLPDLLAAPQRDDMSNTVAQLSGAKLEASLVEAVVLSKNLRDMPRLSALASEIQKPIETVFDAHQTLGEALNLFALRSLAERALENMPYWDRLATRRMLQDIQNQQTLAVRSALSGNSDVDGWLAQNAEGRAKLLSEIRTLLANQPGFSQFALAMDALRSFMSHAT